MVVHDEVTHRAAARVGEVLLGKWRLDQLLGVGGMAAVYAATHRNKSRGAVKILHVELSLQPELQARFLREGRVANEVQHPGIVRVLDDDVAEDGSVFLVMELLEGETLEARWNRMGRALPVNEVLAIADRLLDPLEAAHQHGIIHRDIKPSNIFLTRDGGLKILDFGIARAQDALSGATRTRTGAMLGTPAFMPPEQARGRTQEIDARSDVWAVGATMFTLLTGRLVRSEGTPNELLIQAGTMPVEPLATVLPGVSPAVAELVDRAMRFRKEERWQSARAMQAAIADIVRQTVPLHGHEAPHPYKKTASEVVRAGAQAVRHSPVKAMPAEPLWAAPSKGANPSDSKSEAAPHATLAPGIVGQTGGGGRQSSLPTRRMLWGGLALVALITGGAGILVATLRGRAEPSTVAPADSLPAEARTANLVSALLSTPPPVQSSPQPVAFLNTAQQGAEALSAAPSLPPASASGLPLPAGTSRVASEPRPSLTTTVAQAVSGPPSRPDGGLASAAKSRTVVPGSPVARPPSPSRPDWLNTQH